MNENTQWRTHTKKYLNKANLTTKIIQVATTGTVARNGTLTLLIVTDFQ